jgi:hypothetical protein
VSADALRELRRRTQQAVAIAYALDGAIETPASGRVIVRARELLAEIETLLVSLQPPRALATDVAPRLPPAAHETSFARGDQVEHLGKFGTVVGLFENCHYGSGVLLATKFGILRAPASECTRK